MDKIFEAEFRGLFWGEGCADIQRYTRKWCKQFLYRPRLRIMLREDDSPILELVHAELGGQMKHIPRSSSKTGARPAVTWTVVSHSDVARVCNILLDSPSIPSKKVPQVKLVLEAVSFRGERNGKMFKHERDHIEELYLELRRMKEFDFKVQV